MITLGLGFNVRTVQVLHCDRLVLILDPYEVSLYKKLSYTIGTLRYLWVPKEMYIYTNTKQNSILFLFYGEVDIELFINNLYVI